MKQTNVKILTLVAAIALALACTAGATLAWLTDTTPEVKNVFTTADIGVTLTETFNTDTDNDNKNDAWKAQLIPGYTYSKNPKVTVKANSVDCYLFVKFEETSNPSTYLTYTSTLTTANGWTQGTGGGEGGNGVPTNVWFREVTSSTSDQSWELLKDNQVKISESLTKDSMPTAKNAPKLTYTAYASQLYKSSETKFSAVEAWNNINPTTSTT